MNLLAREKIMNREVVERSVVQEMIGEGHGWWSLSNNTSPFLPSVSSSVATSFCSSNSVYTQPSSLLPWSSEQPESLSQLLLSGLVGEEDKCMYSQFQSKKLGNNWEEQLVYPTTNVQDMISVKNENQEINANEEVHVSKLKPPWNQILQASSPMSCVTSSLGNNIMVECSNKPERKYESQNSSECYSSGNGAPFKKARIQGSSSPQPTVKVRKEKLGDRITALHQLVSPFGKTDTASVLLEAIGYIRFLHGQIEALSLPYLTSESGAPNSRHHGNGEKNCVFPDDPGQLLNDNSMMRNPPDQSVKEAGKKDLRSRGLCLVPVSFPLDIGSDHSIADYWAPAFLGGFGR
ncbi:basic helix-loop-helix (bHLH) DNA-binding superfamily protein [Rhynchospora pubera]|uniref:Basic helix-loop-helix (BHLH) DNA-binding superfamily protein n=1 Tax=Rhynchospora pubera TaxID=906938 RepID=A0AAV8F6R4_9POAL|nr:basic helix-loop-helix (bHLH) DNA-binding superfamily protein [Rhynchospora pubera]